MITEEKLITYSEQYLISRGLVPDRCVFFDIETTGFKASSSHLYLIGAAFRASKPDGNGISQWKILQWLAQRPQEETTLLRNFSDFIQSYDTLLHFNGNRFDIPYLEEKYDQYQIASPFGSLRSVDLYQDFRPLKALLKLDHMNQKSLEVFLGLERDDTYDGGRLIPIYREYCKTDSDTYRKLLLLHNAEDVSGMLTLTSMYSYVDFVQNEDWYPCAQLLTGKTGNKQLLLTFSLRFPVPVPVSASWDYGYLTLKNDIGKLMIPMSEGTLYYYFSDYKNYYYLPEEDQSIHKSVATYVDREYRQIAKADNCYIKRHGTFLPQPAELFTPAFRRNFKDKIRWFSPEDRFFEDQTQLSLYLNALLKSLLS